MSREIPLTQGKVTIVDDEDFEKVGGVKWHASKRRNVFYATRFTGNPRKGGKLLLLHRAILNAPAGLVVDHINGDGLDNRRSNLRLCTVAENTRNRRVSVQRDLPKGVCRTSPSMIDSSPPYRASIKIDGRSRHLGFFHCPTQAGLAYDRAAQELFGDFALLNFPDNVIASERT